MDGGAVTRERDAEGCRRSQSQADVDVGGYNHKSNTHTHSRTKRRTPLKAETLTDAHTSPLLVEGTSCQS